MNSSKNTGGGAAAPSATDAVIREVLHQALEAGRFTCAKCGRTFQTASEFRFNARHEPICRRFCREAK